MWVQREWGKEQKHSKWNNPGLVQLYLPVDLQEHFKAFLLPSLPTSLGPGIKYPGADLH